MPPFTVLIPTNCPEGQHRGSDTGRRPGANSRILENLLILEMRRALTGKPFRGSEISNI